MYIIKKDMLNAECDNRYCLRLNRQTSKLEVYQSATEQDLRAAYPLRTDFDASPYVAYQLVKSFDCIYGGEGNKRTPQGSFTIEKVSKEAYESGYYDKCDSVKFFSYLIVFEDYFIHSDLYPADATLDNFMSMDPISKNDTHTSGCIRVSRENLNWLTNHITVGTYMEM